MNAPVLLHCVSPENPEGVEVSTTRCAVPLEPGVARARGRAHRETVLDRDHGCVICGTTEDLQVHHVVGAADGGSTTPDNLMVLCAKHHREAA